MYAPGWTFPLPVPRRPRQARFAIPERLPLIIPSVLLVFIFLIPLETLGHEAETSSLTVSRLAGMALVGVCILRPRLLLRCPDRLTLCGFALMTMALLQTTFMATEHIGYALGRYMTWIQMLLFYHLVRPLLADPALHLRALYAYIAGSVVTAILLVRGQGLNVVMEDKGRSALGNLDPNVQAAVLGLAAIWLLAILLQSQRTARRVPVWIGWPLVALLVGASLLTGSRGALMALCIALLALPMLGGARVSLVRSLAIVFMGLGIVAVVASQNEAFMRRLERSIEQGDTAGRDYIFASSLDLWLRRPLLGWGLGNNEFELGSYTNTPLRDMHSNYLYALTAGGVVGGCMLVGMFWIILRSAWKLPPGRQRQAAIAGVIYVCAFGATVTVLFFKFFWVALVWATPAATCSVVEGGR